MVEPPRIRIRFNKTGDARFMSHLDLRRALERAVRRAGIPVAITRGFNPHLRFALAAALPVGVGSDGEYADFYLEKPMKPLEFARVLSRSLPPGLELKEAYEVPSKDPSLESQIKGASYRVGADCHGRVQAEEIEAALQGIVSAGAIEVKRRGKKTQTRDIRPLIYSLSLSKLQEGKLVMNMVLAAGPGGSLRPEEIVSLINLRLGGRIDETFLDIHRENLFTEIGGSWRNP